MKRSSVFTIRRIIPVLASLALVLLVAASAYFLTRQRPIPVTGPAEAAASVAGRPNPSSLELGGGYRLEMEGQQGKIVGPISPVKVQTASFAPRVDAGYGSPLELSGSQREIVAPAAAVKAQPAPFVAHLNIGTGYTLEMNGSQGEFVAPYSSIKGENATFAPRVEVGYGSPFELPGSQGQIIAADQPSSAPLRQDLNSGYWLENGQIVKEGSR